MLCTPFFTLLNPLAVVALFFVIGKLIEQITGKTVAFAAMPQLLFLTAGFYGTCLPPKGLVNLNAAPAIHLFPILAFAA